MARTARTAAFAALARALRGSMRSGEPGLLDRFRAVPRLVRATLRGDYTGTTRQQLALIGLGLVYVLSPIDLVPELFLPVIGLADDAFVITWIAGRLLEETGTFLSWEQSRGPGDGQSAQGVVRGEVIAD